MCSSSPIYRDFSSTVPLTATIAAVITEMNPRISAPHTI
jgi:hypothetical protein